MPTPKRKAKKEHRWLSHVETTGVVFSEPVLAEAGNFRKLEKNEIARFRKAREIWNLPKGMVQGDTQANWVKFIFEDVLALNQSHWKIGAAIPSSMVVSMPEHNETLRPSRVLVDSESPVMLTLEVPREQSLDRSWLQEVGRWKATPTTKMDRLLRETHVELGLITNGESWRLIVSSPSETTSWITWTVQTWSEDLLTLAAFKDLLGQTRFFAGPIEDVPLRLIEKSRLRQIDVADQLGQQVRDALTLIVHEFDRLDAEADGIYLQDYSDQEIFESSVAFIMRILFIMYAEENGLLPHGNVTYDRAYGAIHLLTELEDTNRISPEKLQTSYSAYARLLASSRLIHDGSIDPDIQIGAHGGRLFDFNRYPLLEGKCKSGEWPNEIPQSPKFKDSVIRDILRSLKFARADGILQLVSYRTLEVEQIGHMYEGLLDRRVARAPSQDGVVLLEGSSKINEPEPIPISKIENIDQAELIKLITKNTGKTKTTIKNIIEREENRVSLKPTGTEDAGLLKQTENVHRFIKKLGIIRPGGRYVTQGMERRGTGAHYTPPSLTEPIVRHTLEHQVYVNVQGKPGLLEEPKRVKSAYEILDLKVCDPAMGSGAFLVQTTRYLAERLVDSWELASSQSPDKILTMPFAEESKGLENENLLPETREERIVFARRYIAERCIYGVDANHLAVEMAKLSMWITTLSTDRPFTFVDHALKHGNSLVGLTSEQIKNFTYKPITTDFGPLFDDIDHEIDEIIKHREHIHEISDYDFSLKEKENEQVSSLLEEQRLKATLAIAAFFNGSNDSNRESKLLEYKYWYEQKDSDKISYSGIQKVLNDFTRGNKAIQPFNWEIEFPEVFQRNNKGFDAFVGNPPFAGKNTIAKSNKKYFLKWLQLLHTDSHGLSDLVAHFFRRAYGLLRSNGSIGLISTNTIRQGGTRSTGLMYICNHGGDIYRSKRRIPWPGKAAVTVCFVFIQKGSYSGQKILDDIEVDIINAFLFYKGDSNNPYALESNQNKSFQGSIALGMGFTFDDNDTSGVCSSIDDMKKLLLENPKCKERILPFIGGEELNKSPTHSHHRYIINLSDLSFEEAKLWPELLKIVELKVKPSRMELDDGYAKEYWWRHLRPRPELYKTIKNNNRVIAVSRVTKYLEFTFLNNGMIYTDRLVIFTDESYKNFCLLSSKAHEEWALFFSTTLEDRPIYTPSESFETFPFPENSATSVLLETEGKNFFEYRSNLMIENNEGLTAIYNRFHNPDETSEKIHILRKLQKKMDIAVMKAYNWNDINLDYVFETEYEVEEGKSKPWRYRWPQDIRDEVLARLLELNEKRHDEECH